MNAETSPNVDPDPTHALGADVADPSAGPVLADPEGFSPALAGPDFLTDNGTTHTFGVPVRISAPGVDIALDVAGRIRAGHALLIRSGGDGFADFADHAHSAWSVDHPDYNHLAAPRRVQAWYRLEGPAGELGPARRTRGVFRIARVNDFTADPMHAAFPEDTAILADFDFNGCRSVQIGPFRVDSEFNRSPGLIVTAEGVTRLRLADHCAAAVADRLAPLIAERLGIRPPDHTNRRKRSPSTKGGAA
jgi:hypothetical protein